MKFTATTTTTVSLLTMMIAQGRATSQSAQQTVIVCMDGASGPAPSQVRMFTSQLPPGPGRASDGHAPDRSLTIAIHVYNYTKVNQNTLGGAKKEVARILHQAGVETLWAAPSNESGPRLPRIYITIMPGSMSNRLTALRTVSKDALGFAPVADPDGDQAYLFYNRVEAVAMSYGASSYANTAEVLGCAIAHEIGHLLNGPSHSVTGLMSAKWGRWDLRYAKYGNLLFTRQQARLLRQEVERRTDALNLR